jgi:hypothetical protein
MLDLQQEWNESTVTSTAGGVTSTSSVDYRVTGGNNLFIGTEELISASAAELTGITFVQSATSADYRASSAGDGPAWNFEHVLVASGYDPPPPNEVATVLVNSVVDPVDAGLTVLRPAVDVGAPVTFDARAVGGAGNFQYTYGGLPAGCTSSDSAVLTCRPSAPGTFQVWAVATDARGSASLEASTGLLVVAAPSVAVTGNGTHLDVGVTGAFRATISGGIAPFTCEWVVPGSPIVTAPCTAPYEGSGDVAGAVVTGTLSVRDGTGTQTNATFSFTVVVSPTVGWTGGGPPGNATAPTAIALDAMATGGVAPYDFVWLLNSTTVQNSSDPDFTLVVTGGGTYTLLLEVTDSDGAQAVLGPVTVSAAGPSHSTVGGGTSAPSPSSTDALEWALVAGISAGVAGMLLGVLVGRSLGARRPPD